jgi:hypothetical protein
MVQGRRRLFAAVAVAAVLAATQGTRSGRAVAGQGGAPLPRVPKSVLELYLPEEQDACGALYRLYSALPAADLARLHAGRKLSIDGKSFDRAAATKVAAWFNSARWGREPPAERLGAGSVAQSALLWRCEGNVVDFCLQDRRRRVWRTLGVACAPDKVAWVRDGLPLLPSWVLNGWEGGTRPPQPRPTAGEAGAWRVLSMLYRVYAQLSPSSLRVLHRQHELSIRFQALRKQDQLALVDAYDERVLNTNEGVARMRPGWPLDYARSPDLRRRHFGITEVFLTYGRSHPQCRCASPQGIGALDTFPRRYRVVFLQLNPQHPSSWDSKSNLVVTETAFLVAMPADLQHEVLAWRREFQAWMARYKLPDGRNRPGAPPCPLSPW